MINATMPDILELEKTTSERKITLFTHVMFDYL